MSASSVKALFRAFTEPVEPDMKVIGLLVVEPVVWNIVDEKYCGLSKLIYFFFTDVPLALSVK